MGLERNVSLIRSVIVIQMCIIYEIMSNEDLNEDFVYRLLFNGSNMSEVQLETFIIHLSSAGESLDNKIHRRRKQSLTKGSFLRTLRQAQNNIERSAYTIILMQYLNLVNEETPSNLLRIGSMLQQSNLSEIPKERMVLLLDRIRDIVETLSGRRMV